MIPVQGAKNAMIRLNILTANQTVCSESEYVYM